MIADRKDDHVRLAAEQLRTLLDGGVPALTAQISAWLDHLAALMTALGARNPARLARCDVLISGALHSFCANRGIETRPLATRSADVSAFKGPGGE